MDNQRNNSNPGVSTLDRAFAGDDASGIHVFKWAYGYEWRVTFHGALHVGDQELLVAKPSNSWTGTNPTIEVSEIRAGLQPLSGSFRPGYEGQKTQALPHDISGEDLKTALEQLTSVGTVSVIRVSNGNGFHWVIDFLSNIGNPSTC